MKEYFLGIDIGGTKSYALIADEQGNALGFGACGTGNWEAIGYARYQQVLDDIIQQAIIEAGISRDAIAGAGFGIAGFDWPSQEADQMKVISKLGINAPVKAVNDSILGLLAGSTDGWGISITSGTGSNCRGWNKDRTREGRVVGGAPWSGEHGGAYDIIVGGMQKVTFEWTKRGPKTKLTQAFIKAKKAKNLDDLIEGLYLQRYKLERSDVFLVFEIANQGDSGAQEVIRWNGEQLGDMACGVIRQLEFENSQFEVILMGSLFDGSPIMIEAVRETIHKVAPKAILKRFNAPPVIGAVVLGMEQAGKDYHEIRDHLIESASILIAHHPATNKKQQPVPFSEWDE